MLVVFPLSASEPRWNEGIKPDGMYEFALWGLTARWIKEDDKVKKMCFFYMKRFVTCTKIPNKVKKLKKSENKRLHSFKGVI